LQRGVGEVRRASATVSELSSMPSIAAQRRLHTPCARERAQLDAVDCGAASARSAVRWRAGSARCRRLRSGAVRLAPCACKLSFDCGTTWARSAVRW